MAATSKPRAAASGRARSSKEPSNAAVEKQCLEQYKSIRQLIAAGSFTDALQQGYQLLQQVTAALHGASSSSRCLDDLLVGSTLNVVICTAEVRPPDLSALPSLNDAVVGLVSALRQQVPTSAAQHAGTLTKCLLKAVTVIGHEVTAQGADGQLQAGLQQLLASLIAAANLSGHEGLPQQVAVKACQQLPAGLQHCMLVALAHAAGLQQQDVGSPSSKAAQADCSQLGVPLPVVVTCLQQVAAHAKLCPDSVAACVDSLLACEHGPNQAMLQGSMVLLLAAASSSCGAALPGSAAAVLAAAADRSAQHLQQQLEQLRAGGAAHTPLCCPEHQQALLRLQAWVTAQLAAEPPHSVHHLAVSLASYHVASWQHAAAGQEQAGPTAGLIANMLASTAGCLACSCLLEGQQCESGSMPAAAAEAHSAGCASKARGGRTSSSSSSSSSSSKGHGKQGRAADKNGLLQQLQQQLTGAVAQLIAWPALQQAASQPSTYSSTCDRASVELLADKLQAAALSVSSASAAAEGACCSGISQFAAGLWLQALMCRCAAAAAAASAPAVGAADSQEAGDACSSIVQAAAAFLQAIKPYASLACTACKPGPDGPAASAAAGQQQHACRSGSAACCLCASVQGFMRLAAGLVLRLTDSEQRAIRQQWQSTLRSYCRLRCIVAAAGSHMLSNPASPAAAPHGCWCAALPAAFDDLGCSRQEQGTGLCSVLQLVEGAAPHLPLDRLCWMEGVALSQIAAAGVAAQSAAAVQLLQELAERSAAVSSHLHGRLQAQTLMATGMLQLLFTDCKQARAGSSAAGQGDAQAVLSEACKCFGAVVQPAGSPTAAAGVAAAPSRKGRRPAAAKQPKQLQHAEAAGPDALVSAALCHCLLGLVLAAKAAAGGAMPSAVSEPESSADAAQQAQPGGAGDLVPGEAPDGQPHSCSTTGAAAEEALAAWKEAGSCLHNSLALFEAFLAAAATESSGGSSGLTPWYAEEAAAAVLQAWQLAALQDWAQFQQVSLGVLSHLEGSLGQHARQHMAPLLALMQGGCSSAGCGGLSLLVERQLLLASSDASASGAAGSSSGVSPADSGEGASSGTSWSAAAQQQLPACTCELQARALALHALGMQSQQQGGSTGWQLLQQVRVGLAAADAAACAGDTAAAAAGVEQALRQCKAALGACSAHSNSSACSMSVAAACTAGMRSQALGLYMAGLWQLSTVLDAAGNPTDAVRALKQLHRLGCSTGCYSIAALAQANLGSMHSRMDQPDKAAEAVAAAVQLQDAMTALHSAGHQGQGQPSVVCSLVAAATASAQAAVAAGAGQVAAAEQQLQEGMAVLQVCADGSSDRGLWVTDQRAQMLLQLARCRKQLQDGEGAVVLLAEASALLAATGCDRCPCGPWPATWAAVQLELLSLRQPDWPADSGASASSLALAGFQSGSHNNDLFAEFASAADTAGGSTAGHSKRRQAKSGASQPLSTSSATTAGGSGGDKPSGRGRRGKAASTSRQGSSAGSSSGAAASSEALTDPAAWLCSVLQSAQYGSQQPLLLRQACALLSSALMAVGAVQGALMFHHMALGASATQRQLMLDVSGQRHSSNTSDEAAAGGDNDSPLQQHLKSTQVLQQVAAAARQCCEGADEPGTKLQRLTRAVDEAGVAWLTAALQQLPCGTAVCSVSRQAHGSAPDEGGGGDGLLLSRVQLGPEGGLGTALLVQLPGRTADAASSGEHMRVADTLAGVQGVLSDAAASMAAVSSGSLSTPAGKSAWWQQRVQLDQRMARLVQQLDQTWLGPWRCLLMQPGRAAVERAAAAAGQAIVSEHFDSVLDDQSKQVLGQILALLVAHLDACTAAELAAAVQDLSTLAQQRMDGLHLQRLLADLEAAHAAVKAAAATSAPAAAGAAGGASRRGSAARGCGDAVSLKGALSSRVQGAEGVCSSTPARRPLQAVQGTPCAASRSRRVVVPSCVASTGEALQAGRHVKAGGAAGAAEEQQGEGSSAAGLAGSSAAVVVPPSIARHASRRSRLKGLASSVPAISEDLACSSSNSSAAAASMDGAGKPAAKHRQPTTETPSCSSSSSQAPPPAVPAKGRRGVAAAAASATGAAAAGSQPGCGWQAAVILVLGEGLQQLPWESCAGLQQVNMCRCPGLAFAAALAARLQGDQDPSAPAGAPQPLTLSSSFYLLNPDGDLPDTQQTFEAQLQQLCREGVAGERPPPSELLSAVQQHELFLYFGHGAGEQYLPRCPWQGLQRCAASLLMGCSSGRLRPAGAYEAHGPVWDYLMAGAPAVVGNLWDVTDRDIDRFAARVLQYWCDEQPEPAAASSARTGSSSSRQGDDSQLPAPVSVSQSLALSRQACRLPTLIGSAAVCFGLPAVVQPQRDM